jgi:signal transduction histidine kinase
MSSLGDAALAVALLAAAAGSAGHDLSPGTFLLAAAGILPLAVRRSHPIPVLAVAVAATAFVALHYGSWWPFAAILALYSVGAHCPRPTALKAGIVSILVLAVPVLNADEGSTGAWSRLAFLGGRLAPLAAAWLVGNAIRSRRERVRSIEERAAQLERERDTNARRAAAEEQARIAREVHDVVAHNLSVIVVQATAGEAVFESEPERARQALETIGSTGREALVELRRVLGVIRSDEAPTMAPQPTLERLDGLLDQVRSTGLDVRLEVDGEKRELSPALELSAYRIVQEALTNTLRHANAHHATVKLRYDADGLDVEVADDGLPAESNGEGSGLIGMRERAATFGGHVEAGPAEGGGYRVSARLPAS